MKVHSIISSANAKQVPVNQDSLGSKMPIDSILSVSHSAICKLAVSSGMATAGTCGTATAGYYGTATAGIYGTATAGYYGKATAGDYGTATAGHDGTATAGEMGRISVLYWDGKRYREVTGNIGENGLEPNVPYKLNDQREFVKA